MEQWKTYLYDKYVSSGQSSASEENLDTLLAPRYAYLSSVIRQHLTPAKDKRILDLACGYGALLYCLKKAGYTDIVGIDNSAEQVELAHRLGIPEVVHGNALNITDERPCSYDAVFLLDILEHLTRDELFNFLPAVHQILKPDGTLVIHVPNAEGIFGSRIRYGDLTHELCFTPRSMQQALSVLGFEKIRCYEDKPVRHGIKSSVRRLLWDFLTLSPRLLLLAETGASGQILSQNMLVVAHKK